MHNNSVYSKRYSRYHARRDEFWHATAGDLYDL